MKIQSGAEPGSFNLVLRTQSQIPYNKDPAAKQKPNITIVQPKH